MIVVALDTATSAVVSGVVELGTSGAPRELASTYTVDPRAHAELLVPQLQGCLAACSMTPSDVDAVVVGCGPGPFTGLRVGMATAAAFADALGVPVHPVVTLDAMAWAAREKLSAEGVEPTALLAVTDARRREAYSARYDASGTRIAGPAVGPAADLAVAEGLGASGRRGVDAAGAGADDEAGAAGESAPVAIAFGEATRLAELPSGWTRRDDLPTFPPVTALVAVAAEALRAGRTPAALEPLYLRRPDAVPPRPRPVSPALTGGVAGGGHGAAEPARPGETS